MNLIVFTDLDGALLDEVTYSSEPAREALDALRKRRFPLVLASSKTRAEIEPLHRALDLDAPYIVENGGAVVFPDDLLSLGVPRAVLIRALGEIAREADASIRAWSALSLDDVSRLTGLDAKAAERAMRREYDEPFLLDGDDAALARVRAAAEKRGLRVTRGGRFFHLVGANDKGLAAREILSRYRAGGDRWRAVGLGDSANDLGLLREVDHAIIIPRPDGSLDPDLARGLPGADVAPFPGPAGWNHAVLRILASFAEPSR